MSVQSWSEAITIEQQLDLQNRTFAKLRELSDLAKTVSLVKRFRVASASTGELGPTADFYVEPDGTLTVQRSRIEYGERWWGPHEEVCLFLYTAKDLAEIGLTEEVIQAIIDKIGQ